ncbi:IclR family transcriptional regulator [Roseococcus sp. YIM B11640]|uniref:IclR family transcriptional regulator n=1 Tax=Roseococcus sp. YIM B11640 TaxID=3133973 RepID=UPI003C7AA32F
MSQQEDRIVRGKPALEGVAAAGRALSILSAFRKNDRAVSLAELASRTGLVKSTIMRLAVTLEEMGFLSRQPDGGYRLEGELLRLGMIYQQSFRLDAHVVPMLEELVERTGETATFYVRRGEQRLCLFRADSPHLLRMHLRPGDLLPMDNSAPAQVLRIFGASPLPAYAATTALPIYTQGITDPHSASMAMPVFGPGEALTGALVLSGPVARLTTENAELAKPALRDAASRLTRSLGGEFPK